jgi:hypothetical protein
MPLAPGLYEHLLTTALERAAGEQPVELAKLRPDQIPHEVTRVLGDELRRALVALGDEARLEIGPRLLERLLAEIAATLEQADLDGAPARAQALAPPPRQLRAVGTGVRLDRPLSGLTGSTLFTRRPNEPGLAAELRRELASATHVDVIMAFITVSGLRVLDDALAPVAGPSEPRPLRVLTTTFNGITEVEAVHRLATIPGATVKVSFDTNRTRLHAKAWLFHRHAAPVDGIRRLGQPHLDRARQPATSGCSRSATTDLPHVIDHFAGTFETLWNDPEFERFDPAEPAASSPPDARHGCGPMSAPRRAPLRAAHAAAIPVPGDHARPDSHAERTIHGCARNLVVAATGTGKTVVAAFDYALAGAERAPPRLSCTWPTATSCCVQAQRHLRARPARRRRSARSSPMAAAR